MERILFSLLALWPDYKPSVIGIKQYHYEPNGEAYNVYFEQLSNRFGTREIVMYNKLDQHAFASHAAHILETSPSCDEDRILCRQRCIQ